MVSNNIGHADPAERLERTLERYYDNKRQLDFPSEIIDGFVPGSLDSPTIMSLRSLMRVEGNSETTALNCTLTLDRTDGTSESLADFLVNDWKLEEQRHHEIFTDILTRALPDQTDELQVESALKGRQWGRGLSAIHVDDLAGRNVARAIIGSFGAIQELTGVTMYPMIAKKSGNPDLIHIMDGIVEDEERHFRVFRAFADEALDSSRSARIIARLLLPKVWKPFGSTAMGGIEKWVQLLHNTATGEADLERIVRADRSISDLPGLDDIELLHDFFEQAGLDL